MDDMITIPRSAYEQLQSTIRQLQEEITLLQGGRDSRTRSTAPSHDPGRSNVISLRKPGGKLSGGQTGHAGHTLPQRDVPDEIVDHVASVCCRCGKNLQQIPGESYTRRQVVDIPPIQPTCTEHRSHLKTCPSCGFKNHGVYPPEVKGPIQYGPTVEATVGCLSAYQYIPYRRITHFFRDCFRLDLSEGTISKLLTGLSDKATIAYEAIHEQVKQSAVVGADGTGCRVNGKKTWFHVWQDGLHTFIVHAFSRGYQVIEKYFPEGFLQSFHLSHCYASQLKTPAKGHQLCMAHLLRELSNFIKNLDSQWSVQMKERIQNAMELKKKLTGEDDRNTSSEIAQLNKQLDELLTVDYRKFHKKEQAFVKRLNKHRESILTFLTRTDVPPDNNASERAIRNVKVKTKISGQFRNKDGKGADQYAKLRSVSDTTIKNGQEVYATLLSIANNWRIVPE